MEKELLSIETPKLGTDMGAAGLLNALIRDEWEAIDGYNSTIATLENAGDVDPLILSQLKDIVAEELIHVGQLQEILKKVSPNAINIEVGEEEAQEEELILRDPAEEESFFLDEELEDKDFILKDSTNENAKFKRGDIIYLDDNYNPEGPEAVLKPLEDVYILVDLETGIVREVAIELIELDKNIVEVTYDDAIEIITGRKLDYFEDPEKAYSFIYNWVKTKVKEILEKHNLLKENITAVDEALEEKDFIIKEKDITIIDKRTPDKELLVETTKGEKRPLTEEEQKVYDSLVNSVIEASKAYFQGQDKRFEVDDLQIIYSINNELNINVKVKSDETYSEVIGGFESRLSRKPRPGEIFLLDLAFYTDVKINSIDGYQHKEEFTLIIKNANTKASGKYIIDILSEGILKK